MSLQEMFWEAYTAGYDHGLKARSKNTQTPRTDGRAALKRALVNTIAQALGMSRDTDDMADLLRHIRNTPIYLSEHLAAYVPGLDPKALLHDAMNQKWHHVGATLAKYGFELGQKYATWQAALEDLTRKDPK